MAHLSDNRSDRAQLLIVSAFALGVLFVALALILNSAIFTENLASRGETTGGDDVVAYQQSLERGVGELLRYENENVTGTDVSRGTIEARVTTGATDLGTVLTRRSAKTGATSTLSVTGSADGTLLRQTDNRTFTDASGADDWSLATQVNDTRAFRLNVSGGGLGSCTRFGDCFTLTVGDGSDEWSVSINDSSGVTVAVEDPTGTRETCAPVGAPAVVDVTAGTVDGTGCPALNFTEAPDTDYTIEYENGEQVAGTYSLVVDNSSLDPANSSSYSGDPTTGAPAATPALYDIGVRYDYQSATVNYSSTVRVAPGETDG
jgi:hypothetical protein